MGGTPIGLETVLAKAMETRLRQIVEEEAIKAAEGVSARVRAETDRFVLNVMRQYEMQSMSDRLIITVKKDAL